MQVKTNSVQLNSSSCIHIDWFLCDYIDGVTSNCEYQFSEDFGCDESFVPAGDSGGCELSDIAEGVEVSSNIVSQSGGTIDNFTKYNNPLWNCLTAKTFNLYSQELGKVSLIDSRNMIWQWEELTHGSISMSGYARGGTVTFNQGVGTPSFTPGTKNVLVAGMELRFTVTYTPAANSCPIVGSLVAPPKHISYVSSCLFNARP